MDILVVAAEAAGFALGLWLAYKAVKQVTRGEGKSVEGQTS